MTSDPFEEFEFRPLTEGLGFHKRDEKKSGAQFELKSSVPEIEMPLGLRSKPETKKPDSRPTSRKNPLEESKTPETSATVDEILKTLQSKRKIDFEENKRVEAPVATATYRASEPDISSYILDGMLITAASLACLIILLMMTKVDLFGILTRAEDMTVYFALYGLFAGVTWIYLLINRMYLGFTPGEWVFDQRLGLPEKLGSADYSIRVFLRSTLIVVTGLLVLPLVSMLLRKDVAGSITGLPLLKKV